MPELHDLKAPPAAPDFRERMLERAEVSMRTSARRWRLAALAATAAAIAAISAAGVLAVSKTVAASAPTFDQAISCRVPVRGGIPVIDLSTEPTGWYSDNGVRKPRVATLLLQTGSFGANQTAAYMSFQSGPHVFGALKGSPCSKAPAIPLARAGLPLEDTVVAPSDGILNAVNLSCFTGTTIVARQHLRIVHGSAVAGQVAVRTGKKLRPLLYVDWTPKKITVYASGDCHE